MAGIKTTVLVPNTEQAVAVSGANCIVKNRTSGALYVSVKQGITADADDVKFIAEGTSDMLCDVNGTVYLLSASGGKAELESTDYADRNFKSAGGSGSGLSADGTTITNANGVLTANYIGENLLINSDFKINQRGASGTISESGYFVDRWRLTDGTVTINADGTLTLNGTIVQTLENAAGAAVTASVSAGTASYDNVTKSFTVTGENTVISWAKLERGTAATPYAHPDVTTELARCQRFYCYIGTYVNVRASAVTVNFIDFVLSVPLMRATPTITGTVAIMTVQSATAQDGFTLIAKRSAPNGTLIRATKTSHGMTDACFGTSAGAALDAEIY